jgi:hypothetical protein
VRQIKKLEFKVDLEEFRRELYVRTLTHVTFDKGYLVPSSIRDSYCQDMEAMLSKMYPSISSLKFKHFTEAHEHIEFRKYLNTVKASYEAGKEGLDHVIDALAEKLWYIMILLPEELLHQDSDEGLKFETDVFSLIEEPSLLVENLYDFASNDDLRTNGALQWFRDQAEKNLCRASGFTLEQFQKGNGRAIVHATDSKEPIEKQIRTYLRGLPFEKIFSYKVKLAFPEEPRFEHHHIVAGSGHGKTQTLQYFIANDLEKVVNEEATVVVIDSQGDLIKNIQKLDMINENNMVLIDPTDVEFPVCLNLFSIQMDRINSYSRLHREQMINGILELYDFVLGSLLGAEMTQKQSVIFRYVTRLLLHIPDATIHTMLELFQDGGSGKFKEHIAELEGTARVFFEEEFDSKEFTQTKRQVVRRLFGILENQTFNRMFSHPQSKLDLFAEMNAGKVILINTSKDLLKETGTEIFGRFFIAMIAQAAQERATIPADQRMPTYVYIDEAQEYFDDNIGIILSQARKFKVGMIMAHQYLDQLTPKLQSAFMANTSIKFAGGVSMKDARSFSGEMRVDADTIAEQPKGTFLSMIKGQTKKAIPLTIPFGFMENLPEASKSDQEYTRDVMREYYAVPIESMEQHWDKKNSTSSKIASEAETPETADDHENRAQQSIKLAPEMPAKGKIKNAQPKPPLADNAKTKASDTSASDKL